MYSIWRCLIKRNIRSRGFALLASLALVLTATLSGSALAHKGGGDGGGALDLTPFTRVAEFGVMDPLEANALAKGVATAIATYVATVDDTTIGFPANWILGGLEGEATEEAIEEAILRVPTPFLIDPDEDMSAENRKKVNIVEMCNPLFAKKALGVLPVIDGDDTSNIINGFIHAPALPCEVAIYADEDGVVKVEMLNPEAIFTLFFTDVLFGEQMLNPEFAAAIQELPTVVGGEIQTIIYTALDDAGFAYSAVSEPLCPHYRSLKQVARVVAETPDESPYVHYVYKKRDRSDFTVDEVEAIAAAACTGQPRDRGMLADQRHCGYGGAWNTLRLCPARLR